MRKIIMRIKPAANKFGNFSCGDSYDANLNRNWIISTYIDCNFLFKTILD